MKRWQLVMNLQHKVAYHKSPWAGYTFLAFYSIRIISSIWELGYICELLEDVFYTFNVQKFLTLVLGTWYIFYWMDGWLVGWMDRWMDGWMDGWTNGWKMCLSDMSRTLNTILIQIYTSCASVPFASILWPSFSLRNFMCWMKTVSTYSKVIGINSKHWVFTKR